MNILHMAGQSVSIVALAIIASASFNASKVIVPDAMVPVAFNRNGEPGMRMKKPIALLLMPIIAAVLLFMLSAQPAVTQGQGIVLTLQIMAAIGFTAVHLIHLRNAMEVLGKEGKLRTPVP